MTGRRKTRAEREPSRELRKQAGDELGQRAPGWSLDVLIGAIPDRPT